MNRTIPKLDDADNARWWRAIENAKRRLVSQLLGLGLPVVSKVPLLHVFTVSVLPPSTAPVKVALPEPVDTVVAIGLHGDAPPITLLSGADYGQDYKVQKQTVDRNGISDERAFYYSKGRTSSKLPNVRMPPRAAAAGGRRH